MSDALSKVAKKCDRGKFSHAKLAYKKKSPYFGKPTSTERKTGAKKQAMLGLKTVQSTLSLSEAVAQVAAADEDYSKSSRRAD